MIKTHATTTISFYILITILLTHLISCVTKEKELVIATASSLKLSMQNICHDFTIKTGVPCTLIIGSSGKLAAQSQQGAPYDIFIAADTSYTNFLYKNRATVSAPKTFAYGKLILWTATGNIQLSNIHKNKNLKIAIANPKTAPYGKRSVDLLKKLGHFEKIKNQFVIGESIGQTNQFIKSGVLAAAITAQTASYEPDLQALGIWSTVATNLYEPIPQSIVLLKSANNRSKNTEKFYDFLFSQDATEILNKFGYQTAL